MRSGERATHRVLLLSALVIGSTLVLALIVATPYVLYWAGPTNLDWVRLSYVGQSYGATAAIFAGLALLGVVSSVLIQLRQNAVQQAATIRTQHLELLKVSIENPQYVRALRDDRNDHDLPMWAYLNLHLNHIFLIWRLGELPESTLYAYIANEFFSSRMARGWWDSVGKQAWRAGEISRTQRRFVQLVDSAKEHAERTTTPLRQVKEAGPPTVPEPRRKTRLAWSLVAVAAAIAFGAARVFMRRENSKRVQR